MIPAKKTRPTPTETLAEQKTTPTEAKKEPQPRPTVEASNAMESSAITTTDIIEEKTPKVKADAKNTKKGAKMPKNLGGLTMESKVPDLSIKIYEEQLPGGLDKFREDVRAISSDDYWIMAIIHDRDQIADEIFVSALLKPHLHILAIKKGKDTSGRADRRKVSTILSKLGVVFRPEEDASIWANHGVERIADLGSSVAYLTHETEQAQKDGKELYDREEIISNLTPDEIDQLRDGYTRLTHSKHKATIDEQIRLAETAYRAGYSGDLSWREFEATLPFLLQKGSVYKLFKERYDRGVDDRMAERGELVRLCVFIQGERNLGKTYAAVHAFDNMGLRVRTITDGGKTGKMDDVSESDDVLVIDDAKVSDVLGMADNKACKVYRRNSNNGYWVGDRFIVTSNDVFEDWARHCGITGRQMDPAKSRFYICQIVDDGEHRFLDCIAVSDRGTKEQQEKRKAMFKDFQQRFNNIIGAYKAEDQAVDYSDVLGYPAAPAAATADKPEKGWFDSLPDKNEQYKLPDNPSDCLPFG